MKLSKSELFKAAHKLAKSVIQPGDNYRVTFGACLKHLNAPAELSIQQKLENLGLDVWGADFGKARIYLNSLESLATVFGLVVHLYNTGNISSAYLNGEKISNSRAGKLSGGKIYYDIAAQQFVGTELTPII